MVCQILLYFIELETMENLKFKNVFDYTNKQDLHVFINLILVVMGERRAMLIEETNETKKSFDSKIQYVKVFQQQVLELGMILEHAEYPRRMLVFNRLKINPTWLHHLSDDSVLGMLLGYEFAGLLESDKMKTRYRYSIKASLHNTDFDITTEMAPEPCLEAIVEKSKKYETALKKYHPQFKLTVEETVYHPFESLVSGIKEFLETKNKDSLDTIRETLANEFQNQDYQINAKRVLSNDPTIDQKYASVWLYLLLFTKYNPATCLFGNITREQLLKMKDLNKNLEMEIDKHVLINL